MSDGNAGSAAPPVEQERHEALADIKQTVSERREGADDNSSTHALSGQPPASNPGADDATGGIGAGHGGLSSTAGINGPKDAQVEGAGAGDGGEDKTVVSGLIDTFKSVLGLGGAQEEGGAGTRGSQGSVADQAYEYAAVAGTTVTSAAATAAATASNLVSSSSDGATSSAAQDKPAASHDASDNQQPSSSSTATTAAATTTDHSSSSANMSEPTNNDAAAAETQAQPQAEPTTSNDGPAPGEPKEPQPTGDGPDAGNEDGKSTAKRENPDAIPTAGGERLGEKHWGESKVVPDLPPKAESEGGSAGVSSADGQPNAETKDNTAKNTGGATGGPGHEHDHGKDSGEKHGLMDKLKEKIHK